MQAQGSQGLAPQGPRKRGKRGERVWKEGGKKGRLCVSVAMWLYGYVAMWLCGYVCKDIGSVWGLGT
jgi:hypothetical protein